MSADETNDTSEALPISLREATALHMFGRILPEDLPTVAVDAMVQGYDSPHLRLLAGSTDGTAPHELHELFDAAVTELGLPPMSAMTAAQLVIRSIARRAAAERMPPMDALDEIIWLFVLGDGSADSFPDLRDKDLDLDPLIDLWIQYDSAVDNDIWPAPKVVEQIEPKVLHELSRIAALPEPDR